MAKQIELTERLELLILEGAKQCGLRNDDAYFYIEERLYMHEAKDVENFIDWCVKHNKGFGHGNIRQVWNKWRKS